MRNLSGAETGNDGAVDNFRLLDVTPQLDKQYAPGPLANGAYDVNSPARMVFTITNTTDLLVKAGWSFTDPLPANLVIAPTPDLVTTCTATTIVANPGSSSFVVSSGTLLTGASGGPTSCTISVNVTSSLAGNYVTAPADISPLIGLNAPAVSAVTFVVPTLRLQKALTSNRVQDSDQFALSITSVSNGNASVTTTGTGSAITSAPAAIDPVTANVVYTLSESAAGTTALAAYASTYSCINATAGGQAPSGAGTTFQITPIGTDDLTCTFTNDAIRADVRITKTNTPALGPNDQLADTVGEGDTVTYDIVVTNDGPYDVSNAVVRDPVPTGLGGCALAPPPCSATGGATCPTVGAAAGQLSISNLQSAAGVVIPSMPLNGAVTLKVVCTVQ